MIGVPAHRTNRVRGLVLFLVIVTATAACNQAPPGRLPVYPVKGKVLYKANPLQGALVVFERSGGTAVGTSPHETSGPIRATARTGPDGTFQRMTYQGNDGAPAGDYQVGISSTPARSEGNLFSNTPIAKSKTNPDVLRGRYADPKTSGLRASVKEQDNELPPFDLK
jgi:hypothetical protein